MSPIALRPILRSEPLVQFLVQSAGRVLHPRRIGESSGRLDDVVMRPVAAQALVGVVRGDDIDLLAAVQAVHLVLTGSRVTAGVAVEDTVTSGADRSEGFRAEGFKLCVRTRFGATFLFNWGACRAENFIKMQLNYTSHRYTKKDLAMITVLEYFFLTERRTCFKI